MSEWWTYRLASFLMYSPRTYWRLIEGYNQEVWPAQVLVLVLGVVLLVRRLLREGTQAQPDGEGSKKPEGAASHVRARWPDLLLALGWCWIGWGFFWQRYADIHIAGRQLAIACAVQALLLALATYQAGVKPSPWTAGSGYCIAAIAVLFYPCAAVLVGRPWSQSEWAGLMPDPTALATIGFVLAGDRRGWHKALLCGIPLLMLGFGWGTLWSFSEVGSGG